MLILVGGPGFAGPGWGAAGSLRLDGGTSLSEPFLGSVNNHVLKFH